MLRNCVEGGRQGEAESVRQLTQEQQREIDNFPTETRQSKSPFFFKEWQLNLQFQQPTNQIRIL